MKDSLTIEPLGTGVAPPLGLLLLADPEREAVERYLARSDVFVARDGSRPEPIGVLVLTPVAEGVLEIKNIAVREDLQGRGIGRRLLRFAVATAQERGMRALEIGTGNSSLDQLALYQKAGFRLERIDRDFFVRNYAEPIFENGIQCRDMVMLRMELE